jgi:hypothetical protein
MSEPTQEQVADKRPGDEGGVSVTETITIHHDATDAEAEIPAQTLELWQEYGWAEGAAPAPAEESTPEEASS